MERRTEAQIIEIFHLLFLRVMAPGNSDWFTLKGGANLRYFFASPRYSNDIDLDFTDRAPWMVSKTVESALGGKAMMITSAAARIGIEEQTAAKQTQTTLRWKLGLRAPEHTELIRTKIEFSGRTGGSADHEFSVVPDGIVRPYALQAPTVRHYRQSAAIDQKIAALALRSETKARDIFDLDLLLRQRRSTQPELAGLDGTHAGSAAARALEVPFASFTSEVAPFLDPEIAVLYDEATWDAMCLLLAETLGALAANDDHGSGAQ
jgi:predicted nucleotidyltransferase component of viral defense system